MSIDYQERIPNNVELGSNRRLQRALEQWQPNFISWWKDMGPEGFQQKDIYLRTAVSVDTDGWAVFDHVKMPDYRWGIFLAERDANRTIPFGDNLGQPAWQNWIFQRPNATGPEGALKLYGTGKQSKFDRKRA